jgi:uncharacterized protein YcbK (DUF882 family)
MKTPTNPGRTTIWSAFFAILILLLFSLAPVSAKNPSSEGVTPAYAADSAIQAPAPAVLASGDLLGLSGRLRAFMGTTDALDENPVLKTALASAQNESSVTSWPKLPTAEGDSFTVIPLVPLDGADEAGFGRYHVGSWPQDAMTASSARYAPPRGFIGVTEENQETNVSEHFMVKDFLTHDQGNVWPKVLVIQPRLLDKLELLRAELEKEGLPNKLHVMSGFRTPQYNAKGVGKGGRAGHSRHMYGDAADVFVDADGNGWMDDLNGDGKVDIKDSRILKAAAERVEASFPTLIGGIGTYPSNGVHGPFVHVDARGVKARWGE